MVAAPEGTVKLPRTLWLSLFLNEKGRRRRIWSFTATMTWPSLIGESKTSRTLALPETGADAGPCAGGPTAATRVEPDGVGTASFFRATCVGFWLFLRAAASAATFSAIFASASA